MRNIFDVSGRVSVITGGMGQLGTQYAKVLLEQGAKVAVFDIDIDRENRYFRSQKKNKYLKLFKVDITSRLDLERGLKSTLEDFGSPSVLINNAALDAPPGASLEENGAFELFPEKSWDKAISVNLKGSFLACQIIGGHMARRKRGSIINISSIYGNVSPDQRVYKYREKNGKRFIKPVSYSVSKAGIINLSRYLATYWAERNVRVNTLSLGGVFNNQDPEFLKEYCKKVPLGRMAREDEYNGAIIFLASDASSYVTGANIIADGGYTAW